MQKLRAFWRLGFIVVVALPSHAIACGGVFDAACNLSHGGIFHGLRQATKDFGNGLHAVGHFLSHDVHFSYGRSDNSCWTDCEGFDGGPGRGSGGSIFDDDGPSSDQVADDQMDDASGETTGEGNYTTSDTGSGPGVDSVGPDQLGEELDQSVALGGSPTDQGAGPNKDSVMYLRDQPLPPSLDQLNLPGALDYLNDPSTFEPAPTGPQWEQARPPLFSPSCGMECPGPFDAPGPTPGSTIDVPWTDLPNPDEDQSWKATREGPADDQVIDVIP